MLSIRCSSLPLIAHCQAAAFPPDLLITGDQSAANLGSAVHEILAGVIRDGIRWESAPVAARWGLDGTDELDMLAGMGWRIWSDLSEHFPEPRVEVEMAHERHGVRLTGHADVLSVGLDSVIVGDWKAGWLDTDATEQLKGYCWLALQDHPFAQTATGVLVRIRSQEREVFRWTRAELDAWFEGVARRLVGPEEFSPGRHCGRCQRGPTCDGKDTLLMQARESVLLETDAPIGPRIGELYDAAKLLGSFCEQILELVRAEVEVAGTLRISDGRELVLSPSTRRQLVPRLALPVISQCLTSEAIEDSMAISIAKVEAAVKANAPSTRGAKKAALEDINARLESAGAIVTTVTHRLECRRVVEQLEVAV